MFSEKLRDLRMKKGISQEELSEVLDVSRQSISRYENGTAQPDLDKLVLLAKYFEVSTDYLLVGSPEEEQAPSSDAMGTDKITIMSPVNGNVASYHKFFLIPVFGKKEFHPEVILCGVDGRNFWGESSANLAWYRTREDAETELKEIMDAMARGQSNYELKYFVPIKSRGLFDYEIDE
ncbi:transcriptional regulator [Enterococcus sp. JM4C]|uniref:helix-turn-helix domain-containing protein n=1 Tax=Candidatus Enterococcus huntleyi TaxID=1857217 RepID=UPI00137AB6B3|nr:helix-turn-helix domain-containing protein [Enterococcus sp. JM4C]KAF1299314.1 transcriptional regulator [Enterococcus sp. JM4C]